MLITELRVHGLRTLEEIRLPLSGLTVLIGDNGSGKSSLIEACEILRRATSASFLDEFHNIHGGVSIFSQGATKLRLGLSVRGTKGVIRYDLVLGRREAFAVIEEESAYLESAGPVPAILFDRRTGEGMGHAVSPGQSVMAQTEFVLRHPDFSLLQTSFFELHRALAAIQVHLPFEVTPAWAARALDRKSALRGATPFAPTRMLAKLGTNLANAYHTLRNEFGPAHWQETLDYVRLGLGEVIEDLTTAPSGGGGDVWLRVKFVGRDEQIWSSQLSDGMLAYLSFVALFRLSDDASLLAFDEPDQHLHPHLLMRVLDFMEVLSRKFPVLLSTHSDRLLDGLTDPASATVLCELDERGATRLVKPDAAALAEWLTRYRGLGALRGEGYESAIMTQPLEPK